MPLSMHQLSVPVFHQLLESLSVVLDKAEAHCTAANTDPADLLALRLAPDMYTLTEQVQRACFHAGVASARLAGIEVPDETEDEASFDDLRNRISRTRAFLDGLTPAQMAASETSIIEHQTRIGLLTFPGPEYLMHFALPQFMFHVTTAYDIIRHAGVAVSKVDFMGSALR
ncbi:MAG: DUF1993 domain-containing protein [Gammaproteobacteria bacterium]|nr:MAG: DUF1993 domain-containing protein [Gammaproteobacteria bacterium]